MQAASDSSGEQEQDCSQVHVPNAAGLLLKSSIRVITVHRHDDYVQILQEKYDYFLAKFLDEPQRLPPSVFR